MRRPTLTATLVILISSATAMAADPATDDRVRKLAAKHQAAMVAATDAYWRAKLAADKAMLDGVTAQLRAAPGDVALKAARDQLATAVDGDSVGLKNHVPLMSQDEATAALQDAQRRAALTPPIAAAIRAHALLAGMNVDQADQAMGVKGELVSSDADSQAYRWTLSHEAPMQGGGVVFGQDGGSAGADLLRARAEAGQPRPRVIDAVWVGRFENGKLTTFSQQ